jgi:hypothetical protein
MATPRADEIVQLKAELAVLKEREQSEGNPTLKSELNRRIIETHRTMNLLLETQQGKCVAALKILFRLCVSLPRFFAFTSSQLSSYRVPNTFPCDHDLWFNGDDGRRAVGFWRRLGGGSVVLILTVSFHQHHVVLLTRIKGAEPAVFYFASQATAEFVRFTTGVWPAVRPWFRRAGRARDLAHAGGSNTTTADKDNEPLMNQVTVAFGNLVPGFL